MFPPVEDGNASIVVRIKLLSLRECVEHMEGNEARSVAHFIARQ